MSLPLLFIVLEIIFMRIQFLENSIRPLEISLSVIVCFFHFFARKYVTMRHNDWLMASINFCRLIEEFYYLYSYSDMYEHELHMFVAMFTLYYTVHRTGYCQHCEKRACSFAIFFCLSNNYKSHFISFRFVRVRIGIFIKCIDICTYMIVYGCVWVCKCVVTNCNMICSWWCL